MKLNYNDTGKFVTETQELMEELEADAVMLIVFGSPRGSGICCEMRTNEPESMGRIIAEQLRSIADSMEADMLDGSMKKGLDDQNGHQQTELEHPERELRPSEPSLGDNI